MIKMLFLAVLGGGLVLFAGKISAEPGQRDARIAFPICKAISTVAEFQAIRTDPDSGDPNKIFCLTKDIDFSSVGTVLPIDNLYATLDGQGHVLRNLNIGTGAQYSGLILGLYGVVRNLGIENVKISNCAGWCGAVAAYSDHGLLSNVYSTGSVGTGLGSAGGLVGVSNGRIEYSFSIANVTGGVAGGLVGTQQSDGIINQSYAGGPVRGGTVGGLAGSAEGTITDSFALGSVVVTNSGSGAGLACGGSATIRRSYAAGSVAAWEADGSTFGGLTCSNTGVATQSYWDYQTTGQPDSKGTPLTTAQLQRQLRGGFDPNKWSVTSRVTYPYLDWPMHFTAPLATTVRNSKLYTFIPISQLNRLQYSTAVAAIGNKSASLAAVYTMIARTVGVTDSIPQLAAELIDTDFWINKKAKWQGPVTAHASLGALQNLSGPIGDSNVIGLIKSHKAAIIRGTYLRNGISTSHWMLATSFTTNDDGSLKNLIANDPWTGTQVQIDPISKAVTGPDNFPLAGFVVNGYLSVSLN